VVYRKKTSGAVTTCKFDHINFEEKMADIINMLFTVLGVLLIMLAIIILVTSVSQRKKLAMAEYEESVTYSAPVIEMPEPEKEIFEAARPEEKRIKPVSSRRRSSRSASPSNSYTRGESRNYYSNTFSETPRMKVLNNYI